MLIIFLYRGSYIFYPRYHSLTAYWVYFQIIIVIGIIVIGIIVIGIIVIGIIVIGIIVIGIIVIFPGKKFNVVNKISDSL